jgi:hypothetical protein
MRLRHTLISLVFSFIFLAFFSCKDDEISTNPHHQLALGSDTIYFDTVFANVPSITGSFKFYNRNNQPLEISTIELLGGERSPFRLNVPDADEPNSPLNYNVFIGDKDSLFVFVALTAPDLDSDEPVKVEDDLVFTVNGNRQVVKLLAYSQSVVRPETEAGSYVFTGKRPYLIENDMNISGDATFEEGARLFMHDLANLNISGNLSINGTAEKPVVIRGDRLDNIFIDTPYDFLPGQWDGIHLTGAGARHSVNHAFIRNGKTGLSIEGDNAQLDIQHSWIHNFDDYGIIARNAVMNVSNSQITNCGISCVDIAGGESAFTFVTFANYYYSFRPSDNNRSRRTPSVQISNYITEEENETQTPAPVQKADFKNCIIYGPVNPELSLNILKKEETEEIDESVPFVYSFSNNLIRGTEVEEDERFAAIIWNEDPLFVSVSDTLDFRLQEKSPAINKADRNFDTENRFSLDFDGNNRYADEAPDMGAFEFLMVNE